MKDKDTQLLWEAYTSRETLNEEDNVKLTPFEAERLKNAAAAKKLTGEGPLKDVEEDDKDKETVKEESHWDSFEFMNMMVEKGIEYVKKHGNMPGEREHSHIIPTAIRDLEQHFLEFIKANPTKFDDPEGIIAYIEDENLAHDIQNAMGGEDQYIDDALDF